ncbi:hypothetical protein [Sporosarcina sp. FSL K6-3457]|uniref:hypothetical protein n=1 Tax=Sporosarcina sp. FSL K6-3457 TaxID=2978204 RepID=UPI0030F53A4F
MKIRIIFLMFLSIVLMFTGFSSTYASETYSETKLQNKINLYRLNMIADTFKSGDNEIIYHWNDKDGISRSVELIVTVNEESGNISLVKEKNTSLTEEIDAIKTSIEQKDSSSFKILSLPQAKYKLNGGSTSSQFANQHSFDRHKYESGAASSCSRSRYAKDVDVKDLRSSTIALPDEKYTVKQEDNSYITYYIKQYTGRVISMNMSDYGNSYYHRVLRDGTLEVTHHPYCF